jgi:uncharacterized protein YceK
MKTSLLALALAAILAGCGSMQSSTSSSGYGADAPTCQQFRGNMGRGDDARVKEACVRQLGTEGCTQCLSAK